MVKELSAITKELGGLSGVGRPLRNQADLQAAIRDGFPVAAMDGFLRESGITFGELAAILDTSARTLQRLRAKQKGRLAMAQSDRLYRLARIVAFAKESIGDRANANQWMRRPNTALGGSTPLALIETEPGARAVENVLGRIAYGGVS